LPVGVDSDGQLRKGVIRAQEVPRDASDGPGTAHGTQDGPGSWLSTGRLGGGDGIHVSDIGRSSRGLGFNSSAGEVTSPGAARLWSMGHGEASVEAMVELARRDHGIRLVLDEFGPPPPWIRPPGFATLTRFILEQQVSLASAQSAYRRLNEAVGEITPGSLLELDDAELRTVGFSRQKSRYARELAGAVLGGSLHLDGLGSLPDEEVRAMLTAVPGIGPWTADVYLLACLGRPDIWPVGDRALRVAAAEVLGLARVPEPADLERIGERWRPHRSAAARLLWHAYLSRRGRVTTPV
jgi:DNA-3-methyladenine glycosylase II